MEMISPAVASGIVIGSLLISLAAYIWFSGREGTYINILTPLFILQVPACFLFPLIYLNLFGSEYSAYAYTFTYGTLAVESWAFVLAYTHRREKAAFALPKCSDRNFTALSLMCLGLAGAIYAPVLLEFREFILDPREIYKLTRTGFGQQTFVSSVLAYLAVIFILFAKRSWITKTLVLVAASGVVILHGSKGQVLNIFLLLLLFQVYVRKRRIALLPALVRGLALGGVVALLFAATMSLGDGLVEALQDISQYSDYTRNAMLVIDSGLPLQYGRLTMEANLYGRIPRALMPNKPKDFGAFYLVEEFYPEWFDADTGSPDFGIGVQYADFGALALVYLALFSMLKGWLARIFVDRLKLTGHPADFLVVGFLAEISVLPLGGAGWLFPEVILLAWAMRYFAGVGAPSRRIAAPNLSPAS